MTKQKKTIPQKTPPKGSLPKKPKEKISERLTQKAIDERSETLNPQNPKYYKCRVEGITDKQALKLAQLKINKKKSSQ